jgi:hypothetical protein
LLPKFALIADFGVVFLEEAPVDRPPERMFGAAQEFPAACPE